MIEYDYPSLIIVGLLGAACHAAAWQMIFRHDHSRRGQAHPTTKRIVPGLQIAACLAYLAFAVLRQPPPETLDEMYLDWRDWYYLAGQAGLAFAVIAALVAAIASAGIDMITGQKSDTH